VLDRSESWRYAPEAEEVTLLGCDGALLAATAPGWKSAVHILQRPIVRTIGVSVLDFLNIGSIAILPVRAVFKVFINKRCGWSFQRAIVVAFPTFADPGDQHWFVPDLPSVLGVQGFSHRRMAVVRLVRVQSCCSFSLRIVSLVGSELLGKKDLT
jgi:hypothetical protein